MKCKILRKRHIKWYGVSCKWYGRLRSWNLEKKKYAFHANSNRKATYKGIHSWAKDNLQRFHLLHLNKMTSFAHENYDHHFTWFQKHTLANVSSFSKRTRKRIKKYCYSHAGNKSKIKPFQRWILWKSCFTSGDLRKKQISDFDS